MSAQNKKQNENLFVKLLKKSVGLPTADSTCCEVPARVQTADLSAAEAKPSCCGQPKAQTENKTN